MNRSSRMTGNNTAAPKIRMPCATENLTAFLELESAIRCV